MGLVTGLYRGCGCTGIIALSFLIGGIQAVYTAVVNRTAVEMTCAEYLEKKPAGKWVKLKDCELYRIHEISSSFFGKATGTEVFIPIRPTGAPDAGKVQILLASKAPEELEFARGAAAAAEDPKKAAEFILQNANRAKERRDLVEGVVRHGIGDVSDKDRRKFTKATDILAPDFVIIDEGKRPDLVGGFGFLGAGILFAALRMVLVSRKAARTTPEVPPPLPS